MTEDEMRQEGESRKARSIARLRIEGVPTIDHLPWIECDPSTISGTTGLHATRACDDKRHLRG